jgi:PHD/YefM family antitoxin component YafN of YafNO toxin-antitoxin module
MRAQVLEKDGKKEFVILPWEDYVRIQEMLEDYEDLRELRKTKEESKGQKPIPFEKAVKSLKLKK